MFAKLSALALCCVSFVSALTITAPVDVKLGADVALNVVAGPDDPSAVTLVLVNTNVHVDLDVNVAVKPIINVVIPVDVRVSDAYTIVAVKPDDELVVYASTEPFVILAA